MLKKCFFFLAGLALFFTSPLSLADCQIKNSDGRAASAKADPLFTLLAKSPACPENVQALKALLRSAGNTLRPSMVANRGIHNPELGSFSFFEEVVSAANSKKPLGEFFFGHFTEAVDGILRLDQAPAPRKLMIEVIAWDPQKNIFNFYELIGTGAGGQWFYRGDSSDILKDNALLYMENSRSLPSFGNTLRCSACHASGGPIMKEISTPHNDWWTQARPLDFGKNKLSAEVSQMVSQIVGAEQFHISVRNGIQKLEDSPSYQSLKSAMSLKAQLRPLFCELEVNLMSDALPLEAKAERIQIPSASIVNPLLKSGILAMPKAAYLQLLSFFQMRFPETNRQDADHAWLVPVKGYSDLLAIQSLIKNKIVSAEFAADVLAVDLQHPVFSTKRCGLLKLWPAFGGMEAFKSTLKASSLPEAQELYKNLVDPARNQMVYAKLAETLLVQTQMELNSQQGQRLWFEKLLSQRQAVFTAVISKNPRGQILEPGFRVIFPAPGLSR
jgi:hypothetical protein